MGGKEVENFAIGVFKGSIFHSDTKFAHEACGTDVGATWKPQLLKRFSSERALYAKTLILNQFQCCLKFMSEFLSTEDPEAFRRFFVKVNTDYKLRQKFLHDPVGVLQESGLILDDEAKKEVVILRDILVEKVPDIAEIPSEYEELLEEIRRSLSDKEISSTRYDDDPGLL